ncbi:hypothetical protein B0H63DRAFT_473001 [Podospora didyma]|uniref:MARVEL domain-containing protein n=1 Tax=Podospora didyma TaxID=330526 RepID=A0AAE0NPU0_9PEZI|nr:hypothetical protein B0H63DRAFT_473001 [Podospora didyma]
MVVGFQIAKGLSAAIVLGLAAFVTSTSDEFLHQAAAFNVAIATLTLLFTIVVLLFFARRKRKIPGALILISPVLAALWFAAFVLMFVGAGRAGEDLAGDEESRRRPPSAADLADLADDRAAISKVLAQSGGSVTNAAVAGGVPDRRPVISVTTTTAPMSSTLKTAYYRTSAAAAPVKSKSPSSSSSSSGSSTCSGLYCPGDDRRRWARDSIKSLLFRRASVGSLGKGAKELANIALEQVKGASYACAVFGMLLCFPLSLIEYFVLRSYSKEMDDADEKKGLMSEAGTSRVEDPAAVQGNNTPH